MLKAMIYVLIGCWGMGIAWGGIRPLAGLSFLNAMRLHRDMMELYNSFPSPYRGYHF